MSQNLLPVSLLGLNAVELDDRLVPSSMMHTAMKLPPSLLTCQRNRKGTICSLQLEH